MHFYITKVQLTINASSFSIKTYVNPIYCILSCHSNCFEKENMNMFHDLIALLIEHVPPSIPSITFFNDSSILFFFPLITMVLLTFATLCVVFNIRSTFFFGYIVGWSNIGFHHLWSTFNIIVASNDLLVNDVCYGLMKSKPLFFF